MCVHPDVAVARQMREQRLSQLPTTDQPVALGHQGDTGWVETTILTAAPGGQYGVARVMAPYVGWPGSKVRI